MTMFECERVGDEKDDFPDRLRCDVGAAVLELEFQSWSAARGHAVYRDTNSWGEDVSVFNNAGTLVADVRED